MREAMLVAAGGAIGAMARWWVGGALAQRFGAFPWHTLVVNVTGAFLLGVLMAFPVEHGLAHPRWRLFAAVGVLGGFTTFSTLAYESVRLMEEGMWAQGAANIVGSGVAGILAVAAGVAAGRLLAG